MTYSLLSSGEKQSPFGRGTFSVATVAWPVLGSSRYTRYGSSGLSV